MLGRTWKVLPGLRRGDWRSKLIAIADRHYMIERGCTVWSGTSKELGAAPDIQHRYLGV